MLPRDGLAFSVLLFWSISAVCVALNPPSYEALFFWWSGGGCAVRGSSLYSIERSPSIREVSSYSLHVSFVFFLSRAILLTLISDLTGTQPEATSSTLAGTTHDLNLETAYYKTTVPVWLDLIVAPEEWAASFLTEEAKEVLEVLGGVIVVFAIPLGTNSSSPSKDLIREVGKVIKEGLGGWEWDGVTLAVGVGEVDHLDDLDTWDEVCGDAGLEFVHVASSVAADTKNEFGGEFTR